MNVENIDCSIEAAGSVAFSGQAQQGTLTISAVFSVEVKYFNKGDAKNINVGNWILVTVLKSPKDNFIADKTPLLGLFQ